MKKIFLSVIIPCYNEEANLKRGVLNEIGNYLKKQDYSWEVIVSDDGSTDNSLNILRKLARKDSRIKVIKLLSNYGQSTALAAGIKNSCGELIVTMDSDLQHDPKDIIPTLKLLEEYDIVCGWRKTTMQGPRASSIQAKALGNCAQSSLHSTALETKPRTACSFTRETSPVSWWMLTQCAS